ncbi:telomeric repeat-binding factor 2-like [Notechis scutatus]|uniref:Telomeric repeat-binding factor 2-like n=1 Tax=Notechis scutatus TaxID=8663 RepID=A0A6J1W2K6_9SAUR|nr:telomeric repeat-binding factor 2-like [Notechis scutatus]XP_026549385.1 telomeric repeat-binding factor 2-like [Notechis scutatus]
MAAMAAAAEARRMELEAEANRWAVLFYAHQALRAFRAGNSRDFRELRDVLTAVLARPLALEEPLRIQLRIIQILSRLEEGERGRSPSLLGPGAAGAGWPLPLRSQPNGLNRAVRQAGRTACRRVATCSLRAGPAAAPAQSSAEAAEGGSVGVC